MRTVACVFTLSASLTLLAAPSKEVTYHKDVAPILQRACQECHRAGEAGPMQFTSYKETRPWAKAIKQAINLKKMPPWFADPAHGKFQNDRRLTEQEIATLNAWADSGAKEGNPKDSPAPVTYTTGWTIGKPDLVYEMPKPFAVPASGTVEYHYMIIPTGFTEDKWVELAEIRPGNRAVNHHILAFVRPKGSKWFADQPVGEAFLPNRRGGEGGGPSELLVGYAPGVPAQKLPPGQARLVPAGADLVLQLHYTANGKATTDQSKIGIIFSKEPPKERVLTLQATNSRFEIPPMADNHLVTSSFTLNAETKLVSLTPHMHVRGKAFEYRAVYPTGETEILLKVPRYDFNWQLYYYLGSQKILPKGTKIECSAWYDNSPNNPSNPDPKAAVKWGDQSWEEMMIGFFDVSFDANMKPSELFPAQRRRSDD